MIRAMLNKSPQRRAPCIGMGCEAQTAAMTAAMSRMCNTADRPTQGCPTREGLGEALSWSAMRGGATGRSSRLPSARRGRSSTTPAHGRRRGVRRLARSGGKAVLLPFPARGGKPRRGEYLVGRGLGLRLEPQRGAAAGRLGIEIAVGVRIPDPGRQQHDKALRHEVARQRLVALANAIAGAVVIAAAVEVGRAIVMVTKRTSSRAVEHPTVRFSADRLRRHAPPPVRTSHRCA